MANLGLACCSLEVEAAVRSGLLVPDDGTDSAVLPEGVATVLLVSGTVTHALAPSVSSALSALPPGTRVIAFGACATSGGPYWDSPAVLTGVDRLVPVHAYVPGCPPRPEALLAAIVDVAS
jgi:NADH-quinone oxidoreductase subunit B